MSVDEYESVVQREDLRPRRLGRRVFISYSHCESEAMALVEEIEALGISCFVACRDIPGGTPFLGVLVREIDNACALVFVEDSQSVTSKYCEREVQVAFEQSIPIIRVRREECVLSKELNFLIGGVQLLQLDTVEPSLLTTLIEKRGVGPIQRLWIETAAPAGPELEAILDQAEAARQDGAGELAEQLFDTVLTARGSIDRDDPGDVGALIGSAFAALQRGELAGVSAMFDGDLEVLEPVASTAAERSQQAARLFLLRSALAVATG